MSITAAQIGRVAEAYTEAWCSRSGIKVATFFSDNATSTINKGEPSVGRAAIADAFEAFFLDLPDLVLYMDDLRTAGNQAIYLWTLEGTQRDRPLRRHPRLAELGAFGRPAHRPGRDRIRYLRI